MGFIIALIVLLAAVILYGTWSRKKIYKKIDELESWKIEIMNRPVTDEISKVKRLKMDGQTETKFETWRSEWDDIITVELPEVEEKLFETEDAADKYRFRKANAILGNIKGILNHVEERIDGLLKDLEQLVTSEEQNREDIVSVKEAYHEAKKELLTNRRNFQKAVIPIEKELQEIGHAFESYEDESDKGNYLAARETLLNARKRLDSLKVKMNAVPALFTELKTTLPEQIKELREGYRDMLEQGYVLEHLTIDEELAGLEERLSSLVLEVEQTEIGHPQEEIKDIHERLEMLYDHLEEEVASRKYVVSEAPAVKEQIAATDNQVSKLKSETELVQLSYRIEQEDLEVQEELEKDIEQLKKKFKETEEAVREQKQSFSMLQEKLEGMKERLAVLEKKRSEHEEMLRTLRKDELKAKETLGSLRKQLVEAKRLVQKSNLPGIPEHHLADLELAAEKLDEVADKLNEKPLEMAIVNRILNEALEEVGGSLERTKKMIEDADLAERLIQYGNRYRSRYQAVQVKLSAAEASFRNYHYEEALELAAEAVQQVEPDILRKFEVSFETEKV
ncbi:MAG TPA: septation ring formation regulator EzrA [Bacillales bacterium]